MCACFFLFGNKTSLKSTSSLTSYVLHPAIFWSYGIFGSETFLWALMSVCLLVGPLVCLLACHNFKFHFHCSYRSNCSTMAPSYIRAKSWSILLDWLISSCSGWRRAAGGAARDRESSARFSSTFFNLQLHSFSFSWLQKLLHDIYFKNHIWKF